jgi:hypothetical protein
MPGPLKSLEKKMEFICSPNRLDLLYHNVNKRRKKKKGRE